MLGIQAGIPTFVFASETVVFDDYGKPVIKCPTEAEAVEYIMNRLESEVIQDDI